MLKTGLIWECRVRARQRKGKRMLSAGKTPEKRVEVEVSWHVSEKATIGWLGRFL